MKLTRILIVIAAVILVIAGCTAVVYIADNRFVPESGMLELGQYTCAWETTARDTLVFEMQGELPENTQWSYMTGLGAIEVKQQGDEPVFTVKGTYQGGCSMGLSYRESGYPFVKGVDLRLDFTVEGKKNTISLADGDIVTYDARVFSYDNDKELYYQLGDAGSVFLFMYGTTWQVDTCEGVNSTVPTVKGEWMRMEVYPMGEASDRSITVIDSTTNKGFKVVFSEADGALGIKECSTAKASEKVEETVEETDPEYEQFLIDYTAAQTEAERLRIYAEYWNKKQQQTAEAYQQQQTSAQ